MIHFSFFDMIKPKKPFAFWLAFIATFAAGANVFLWAAIHMKVIWTIACIGHIAFAYQSYTGKP